MRIRVANVSFDNVTMEETVQRVVEMCRQTDRARYVCTGNMDHLVTLQHDAEFRAAYQGSDLVIADGMPIIWLSRLAGGPRLKERVAGSDLFWQLARVSESEGLRMFYLGGAEGAAEGAAEAVRKRYPGAQICGIYCPSFEKFNTEEEQAHIRSVIQEAAPHVLMVALGAPKQEKWIVANKDLVGVPVSIGVGGSFEMASGVVRRAPKWMQRTGLEWAYRLVQEPSRMAKRYLVRDLPFFMRLIFQTAASSVTRKA